MTPAFIAASLISACLALAQAGAPAREVIAEVLVHGNQITAEDEIVRLSGLTIGAPFETGTIETVRKRLRDAHRFVAVDVRKLFASIADPSKIAIVIVVNEGPVSVRVPEDPNAPITVVRRRRLTNVMFMPIVDGEDGYGLTYGVRVAYLNVAGKANRLSFPLTWGGSKRAGMEFERTFRGGPFTRLQFGTAVERKHNPAFDEDDDRRGVWVRAERGIGSLRLGATSGWQTVSFADTDDRIRSIGADATFDTRLDPALPRNAVFASASWSRLRFRSGPSIDRTRFEGRGYLGLVGQSVLALRAVREEANHPQPAYLQSLLGGWSNLRGFKAGSFVGDTLVAGSIELTVPVSSPLSLAKLGVTVFADGGKAYAKSQRFDAEPFQTGFGAGAWMAATGFRLGISVAHGRRYGTRVNFGAGVAY